MRIEVPFVGTVIGYKPGKIPELDEISGDPNDPIRIDINLGNVSWQLISLDIETGLAELEVLPAEEVAEDTGQVKPTELEKLALLDKAKAIAESVDKTNRLIRKDLDVTTQ